MLKFTALLLPITVVVILIMISKYDGNFIIRHAYLQPKTHLEIQRNNVTKYIEEKLLSFSNLTRREAERQFFNDYLSSRQKIIKLLPRLSQQNVYTTFHILFEKTRKLIDSKYELVILISSYSLHFERRRNIRQIWGNVNTSISKNWKIFFLTGGVNDKRGMINLFDEAIKERDIIIEDFMESYSLNMGKKVMSGLQWLQLNFLYDYVLKCDDDVFVDVDFLLSTLRKMNNKFIYMGNVMVGSEVLRSGRYAVPVEEYPAKVYEPYCSGGGFVLSYSLVENMIPFFQWEHPLRIDDAYFGGRVIKAGGKATDSVGFRMWNDDCKYDDKLLVTHPAGKKCLEKLHKMVSEKKKNYT